MRHREKLRPVLRPVAEFHQDLHSAIGWRIFPGNRARLDELQGLF